MVLYIVLQIILSILVILLILIQPKGTGIARSWKATSASFTRRGLEKLIFKLTFVFIGSFILISVLQLTL